MPAKLILPAIAAGLVVLAGCDFEDLGGSFERYPEDFHYNYPLKSGSPLSVDGFNGSAEVHTSNGHIRAEGIRGALEATTSNSSIHAILEKVDGSVRVQSSNGGIDLTLPSNVQSAVRAHTSNNGITLHLPGEVNARLSAATSNASISSDFEMRMRGEISKHH